MATIMVIDDDPAIRRSVRRILEGAEYEVLEASEGKAGFLILDAHPVRVVVTDIYMPGQDGIMTIRRLRKEWPQIAIIVISGGGPAGDLNEGALALGARSAIHKPFTSPELLQAVRSAMGDDTPPA